MVWTSLSAQQYTIDTPGFADYIFTAESRNRLDLPGAVQFTRERDSVLQSAREAVAVRMAAEGADFAEGYQITRTAAIYIKDKDRFFVAFDDATINNILLARSQEGHDSHDIIGKWLVRKDNLFIRAALERAENTDRIVPIPLEETVWLATTRNPSSPYGTNPLIKATIGDLAEHYADFLNRNSFSMGCECFLSESKIEELGVDNGHVEVRSVGVGGGNFNYFDYLLAYDQCNYSGWARGVARNTPIGNRGAD